MPRAEGLFEASEVANPEHPRPLRAVCFLQLISITAAQISTANPAILKELRAFPARNLAEPEASVLAHRSHRQGSAKAGKENLRR